VRQYQQGFGRPIISAEVNGFRVVAISNSKKIKWSAGWRWFTDFLLDHLKDTLGREWGTSAQGRKLEHPIFRWLKRMNELSGSGDEAGDIQHEPVGFVTSVFRLGYALYLIEHHDQLDESLVARLRRPQAFQAAYYETLIAAAFAVSGATIEMAERRGQSKKTPEFWAIGRSGRRYAVEAKCKSGWKCRIDPRSDEFRAELRQWLRDQIYNASVKRLQNAVYCFELSIPETFDEETWIGIQDLVRATLLEAEAMTVDREPTVPAYVIVTNHAHLVNDYARAIDQIAMLDGYKLETFRPGVEVPLETALEWHDEHRDITWLMKSMEEVERIPSTFDGTPPEFVAAARKGENLMKIGEQVEFTFPDSTSLAGILKDVLANGDRAHVVVEIASGEQHIAEVPLTETEAMAARRYGNAVFGKAEKRQRRLEDITELYDWFLEVYSKYDRDALLRQIADHPERVRIGELPLNEMRVRVAREVTKAAYHHTMKADEASGAVAMEVTR
jgi:hypothetical protein